MESEPGSEEKSFFVKPKDELQKSLFKWADQEALICHYVQKNNFNLGIDDSARFIAGYLIYDIITDDAQVWITAYEFDDFEADRSNNVSIEQILLEMEIGRFCLIKRLTHKLDSQEFQQFGDDIVGLLTSFRDEISHVKWLDSKTVHRYERKWKRIVKKVKFMIKNIKSVQLAYDYVADDRGKMLRRKVWAAMKKDGIID